MKKKKIAIVISVVLLLAAAVFGIARINSEKDVTPQEMMLRLDEALGDEYKRQTMTEVVATLVYGDGTESHNINYHVLKTTYYKADPTKVTGLNIDALRVLFDPDLADSCQEMKIQDWDAALYETGERSYLCWTYSPKVSYVLEYNPDAIADEEIIKMAQSAEPLEEE